MTTRDMQAKYDALTTTCEGLCDEIRKGDPDTVRLAIAQFEALNGERIRLMGLLNLIPVPRA